MVDRSPNVIWPLDGENVLGPDRFAELGAAALRTNPEVMDIAGRNRGSSGPPGASAGKNGNLSEKTLASLHASDADAYA